MPTPYPYIGPYGSYYGMPGQSLAPRLIPNNSIASMGYGMPYGQYGSSYGWPSMSDSWPGGGAWSGGGGWPSMNAYGGGPGLGGIASMIPFLMSRLYGSPSMAPAAGGGSLSPDQLYQAALSHFGQTQNQTPEAIRAAIEANVDGRGANLPRWAAEAMAMRAAIASGVNPAVLSQALSGQAPGASPATTPSPPPSIPPASPTGSFGAVGTPISKEAIAAWTRQALGVAPNTQIQVGNTGDRLAGYTPTWQGNYFANPGIALPSGYTPRAGSVIDYGFRQPGEPSSVYAYERFFNPLATHKGEHLKLQSKVGPSIAGATFAPEFQAALRAANITIPRTGQITPTNSSGITWGAPAGAEAGGMSPAQIASQQDTWFGNPLGHNIPPPGSPGGRWSP